MLILDCSSRTQALHTLSAGFGCPPEKLKKVLLSLDLESIYELNPRQLVDAPQYLREYVCAELGEPGPFTQNQPPLVGHGAHRYARLRRRSDAEGLRGGGKIYDKY